MAEGRVIPSIVRRLREGGPDSTVTAEHNRALSELAELDDVLRNAVDAEDLPADPYLVELGDTVRIEMDDGTTERYLIVHPTEARVDRLRISSESPMSKAILGRRVGEQVEVVAPSGRFSVRILGAERESAQGRRQ